jgi:hypothetical protein
VNTLAVSTYSLREQLGKSVDFAFTDPSGKDVDISFPSTGELDPSEFPARAKTTFGAGVDVVPRRRHQLIAARCRGALRVGDVWTLIALVLGEGGFQVVGMIAQCPCKQPGSDDRQAGAPTGQRGCAVRGVADQHDPSGVRAPRSRALLRFGQPDRDAVLG